MSVRDYVRWNVSVLTSQGNPHPDWQWIERKGPWVVSTTEDLEGYGSWQDLHLHERGPGVDEPAATFEDVKIRIGPRAIRVEGTDRPPRKARRDSGYVKLELTPDLEPAVRDILGD